MRVPGVPHAGCGAVRTEATRPWNPPIAGFVSTAAYRAPRALREPRTFFPPRGE